MARRSADRDKRVEPVGPGPAADAPGAGKPADLAARAAAQAAELEMLRTILSLTKARIAYQDKEGRYLYATEATARATGIPVEQLLGRTLEDLGVPEDLRRQIDDLRRRLNETGQPVHDVIGFAAGGAQTESELHAEPVFGPDGEIVGSVSTGWDVTELRNAVRRIQQLDRVRAILSETNQAIVRIRDVEQLLAETCRIAVEQGGFSLAWIGFVEPDGDVRIAARAGRDVAVLDGILVSVRDEPSGRGVVGTAIRENRPAVIENATEDDRMAAWRPQLASHAFRTAAAFPISMHGRAIGAFALYSGATGYFDAEEMTLLAELATDISYALESLEAEQGRQRAEEALRESEQRYRELFEKNPNPMWVYDVDSLGFLAVNDAVVAGYGYSRDELLAMTLHDIHPPEDITTLLENVSVQTDGFRPPTLSRHRRKDGTVVEAEVTGHDVAFYGSRARLVSAIDVSERRRLERQLAEEERMKEIGHLAGGIAHDFNNLLVAVNGYAELLVDELGDSPLAEDAREIHRAGERAAELTKQILAFARRTVLAPQAVDVNAVVGGVSQMLGRVIGEHVRLVTKRSREPAVVMADPGQLEQVLVNLAINARDAMPDGGTLEIRVQRLENGHYLGRGPAGPAVLLTVTDTGSGMDESTLAHAFEPFFTTKRDGSGSGLGLASVYGIIRASRGEVWAESSLGHGTKVSVLLPAVDASPEWSGEAEPALPRAVGKETVLVAEDEPMVRGFVVQTLERAGYHVLVAGSPAEAVALTDGLDEPIDLLLTDMVMPGSSGQALAERLLESRPSLRVVVMSGYDAGLATKPLDARFHFLAKPFAGEELTEAVARALAE